jgi:hypothetical protein
MDMRSLFLSRNGGCYSFGIKAQVAILGTRMIIWFWNLLQDGKNKARSQDW